MIRGHVRSKAGHVPWGWTDDFETRPGVMSIPDPDGPVTRSRDDLVPGIKLGLHFRASWKEKETYSSN